jgi:5'-nucleotidase
VRFLLSTFVLVTLSACGHSVTDSASNNEEAADQIHLTILGTNDIHGGLEPRVGFDGARAGGMAFLAGAVDAIRTGLKQKLGADANVLLVDAGDQAQGTLLSNFNEGELILRVMQKMGYDAIITGNHDYDFGPRGWLVDQVTPTSDDQNPRGALEHALSLVDIPVVSSSTYLAGSIVDANGAPVAVTSNCTPPPGSAPIAWAAAARPAFLKPSVVKELNGVRVGIIGVDNVLTPTTTTPANVADLCFRDEVDSYLDARAELEGKADVFVAVMHDGDTDKQTDASTVVKNILARGGPGAVQAVIAGHTHFVNNVMVDGVPMIQSGSNGDRFGRIDLVVDKLTHAVDKTKTRVYAGVRMLFDKCDPATPASTDFCSAKDGQVAYEGQVIVPNDGIAQLIAAQRTDLGPIAGRKIGDADGAIVRDRINESPLADALTDALLRLSATRGGGAQPDIAMLNTGGIRDNFRAGAVTYENLFSVFPFNNHAVVVTSMSGDRLLEVLNRSIQSCGAYGSAMQSGLRVTFERDCARAGTTGIDAQARLLSVETAAGEKLLDVASGVTIDPARMFTVATLDFLSAGGDGFDGLRAPQPLDLGILREQMADDLVKAPAHFRATTDGRWTAVAPAK